MSQLGYMIARIRGINLQKMASKTLDIHLETEKSRLLIYIDMIWCGLRYQAGYMDYALFEMYNMNGKQRSSILTRGKNNRYVAALNNRTGWAYFESKVIFLKTFSGYVGRRWIDLTTCGYDAFREFALSLGQFIAKPPAGTHGDNVERIVLADVLAAEHADFDSEVENPDSDDPSKPAESEDKLLILYNKLLANKQTLCEEVIAQHEGLSVLYAGSVNTIRTITILSRGEAHVVAAYLRIGNGGRVVDNFNNGGMVVPVDTATGKVLVPAADKAGHVFENHPVTGTPIVGAQIPLWPQCLELVKAAAQVMPMVRYVGWDIAVTPNGPVLVEGNQFPGHDIYGLPAQTPDKIGILPAFEAVVPLKALKHI